MRIPRRGRLVAAICTAALVVPASAGAAPNQFLHDVDRVNSHLRVAIEYAPEELGEALGTAQVVCGLGERATSRGEADAAASDWATLTQLVDEIGAGAEHRVQVALANADSTLRSLRERYERRWPAHDPRRGRLRHGVHTVRIGIKQMRQAIGSFDKPFASWRAHDCAAANTGVEKAFRRIPTGLRLIDLGMLELWRLAGLLPEPAAPRA